MLLLGIFTWLFLSNYLTLAEVTPRGLGLQSLNQGSSLTVGEENQFLISPNGTFSSGFYQIGNNSFCFAIWFTQATDKTVVWMANRDNPVYEMKSRLTLDSNGNLILTNADDSVVWSTNTFTNGNERVKASLLETGNLVLQTQMQKIIWQSFDFPTDTLLPGQPLQRNSTLVSMKSPDTYLSGFYNFRFNDENMLSLIYVGPLISSMYWPDPVLNFYENGRTRFNNSRVAVLNIMGGFQSSDLLNFNATDYGIGPKRRLTLDHDGVLRLYSLIEPNGTWTLTWFTSGNLDVCLVHGLCGENGICTYNPLPTCSCPFGFNMTDSSDWSKGCKPSFNLTCNSTKQDIDFIMLPNTDFYGYDLDYAFKWGATLEECRGICLNICECKAFGYILDNSGRCYPKGALLNGYKRTNMPMIMHIKIQKETLGSSLQANFKSVRSFDLDCSASELVLNNYAHEEKSNRFGYMRFLVSFVAAVGILELIFIGFGWWNLFRKRVGEEMANMGYVVLAMGFKRFAYGELKKATKNFKDEIGKGGFGCVYKGVLDDGRVVAVKRLEGVIQGEAEFWAEVSIIGKINHKNLVKLWGFCTDDHHKMLVYEFIKCGSLDKFSSSDSSKTLLGLNERLNIAIGTAKGLSYLHEECLEWVLHCDVKPQNILLDEDLEPKIADFGMSKLFRDVNDIKFSKIRGTRGYLAPEWTTNSKIDAKVDVYSYGIVLLELLSGKNAYDFQSSAAAIHQNEKCLDLAQWVSKNNEEKGLKGVIDGRLGDEYDQKKAELLLKVGLLCVERDYNKRPAMSKVVELLTSCGESTQMEINVIS